MTEVILRAVQDSYSIIGRGEYLVWREAVLFAVEILRRRPELLVDVLALSDEYDRVAFRGLKLRNETVEVVGRFDPEISRDSDESAGGAAT